MVGRWRIRLPGVNRSFCSVWTVAIASRLAPTFDLCTPQIPCGSEPARDGRTSVHLIHTILLKTKQALG
ncbi:hypothetical protein FQ185_09400 [Pseudomonas sp. ANT_H12B]|nr:hypothetical protein FQ185_09400 [Pseudomonas sp. ANT_H12B]